MNKFKDIFIPIACVILLLLLLSTPIFFAKNCEDGFEKSQENAKKYFKEYGFLGEHNLNKIKSDNQLSGKISGSYFLVAGSISGDFKTNKNYSFYWEISENNFIFTAIPASKFRFIIDNSKITPTVEFIFDLRGFYQKPVDKPNKYIEDDRWLSEVIIRISRKDFDKEVLNEVQSEI